MCPHRIADEERRYSNDERLTRVEEQLKRLISDLDSEKDTRRRTNMETTERFDKFDDRMRRIEHMIWWSSGAVALVVFLVQLLPNLK